MGERSRSQGSSTALLTSRDSGVWTLGRHPACRQCVLDDNYECSPTFLGNSIAQFLSVNFINASVMSKEKSDTPARISAESWPAEKSARVIMAISSEARCWFLCIPPSYPESLNYSTVSLKLDGLPELVA